MADTTVFTIPEEALRGSPALRELMNDPSAVQALQALSPHDPMLCRKVFSLCRPLMAGEPAEDAWLSALYTRLSDNMFPDDAHPACEPDADQVLYLTVLDAILALPAESFEPLSDLIEPPPESIPGSRVAEQYRQFRKAAARDHVVALMRIGREIQPFDPASHTIGVHNIALHTAIMAVKAGIPVDLPLVSAAALGHDVGKFGCRGEDARRIPYLHYYFTWQWFRENGMEEIGYISANHSTWDLEFENLPVESLLLIYADFRVRGTRGEDGKETVRIYSLAEAYEMVFSKLYNMTEEKARRYQNVYDKLRDFELFLREHGVPVDLGSSELTPAETRDPALLSAGEALQALRSMTLSNSIELMRTVSTSESFEKLLEQAKGEKNLQRIRTYLHLLQEYSVYMTRENKKKTLALLYELLTHQDGDVRRRAAVIMGQILANSGPKYRKELPGGARPGAAPPTIMALLDESVELWEQYIELCLHPDHKMSASHARRISNSLKAISRSLFDSCDDKERPAMLRPLTARLRAVPPNGDCFSLADAFAWAPYACIPEGEREEMADVMAAILEENQDIRVKLRVLKCLERMNEQLPELSGHIRMLISRYEPEQGEYWAVLSAGRARILGIPPRDLPEQEVSRLYLSNLKNAVHWTVKLVQMEMLCSHARVHTGSAFHTAMHLSNLLSVSEHLPVRQAAGQNLLMIAPLLTVDQLNEITVDLLRELENGREQISRFIPPFVGRLICRLPERELREAMDSLESMVQGGTAARRALVTLGEVINALPEGSEAVAEQALGLILTGIAHYKADIHQAGMVVLCRNVFGSEQISAARRHDLFVRVHKKLLTLLSEPHEGELTFFNRAAMLNHLYRYIVWQEVTEGPFRFLPQKPAAFFPGTFDPFSVGHKRIVEEIRRLGFEVYLAVDEFSWSKRTLARLRRRRIAVMSVADQWDTYLFPDAIPVNIAMAEDLALAGRLLPGDEWYLVAGSDVIRNASAYRTGEPGGAADCNHIVFYRDSVEESGLPPLESYIRGKLRLLSLPPFFETVSSTRIREYVDKDLDVSMLVDPVVQTYIYEYGLYIRTPEEKTAPERQDLCFHRYRSKDSSLPAAMNEAIRRAARPLAITLTAGPASLQGWAVGHTLQVAELYDALGSLEAAGYVRRHTSGRILMLDTVEADNDPELCRMLLNELLARSLESDHTYAVCRCPEEDESLLFAIGQLGFVRVLGDIWYVDMRQPMMLLQDVMLQLKEPHRSSPAVREAVRRTRPRLRRAFTAMFPGRLLLCFDSELLNQALMERVQKMNGVEDVPPGVRRLGPYMCVPYGKILADEIVPNTVTKTLHAEKQYSPDVRGFDIVEYPGYSPLHSQVRTLKAFRRPVILVDDLLHRGYRLEKLDRVLRDEKLSTARIITAVMSGYGQDLMRVQGRQADCEYFIPNLQYWETESLLYPFLGGDSVGGQEGHMLKSINMILPYVYPAYLDDAAESSVRNLSRAALENACEIMHVLEREHQQHFNTALTLRRLGEAICRPRLPDRGSCLKYDFSLAASDYLAESLARLERTGRREAADNDV